jgi:hypothetical protein
MTKSTAPEADWKTGHRKRVAAMPATVREAHAHCSSNWTEITSSDVAGCFYCLSIFSPSKIDQWYNEESFDIGNNGSQVCTAFCPDCHIDSVIGSRSGFPIDREFLTLMQSYWF